MHIIIFIPFVFILYIVLYIYKGDLNLKWQSVLLDTSSVEIQSLIRALGIVFCKITGPLFLWLKSAKRAFYALTLKTLVNRDWMCEKFQVQSTKRAFYALTLKTIVNRDWIFEKFQVQSEHFMLSRLRPLSTEIGCARNFKCKASISCSHA